ncbi:MAG: hypothetical protein NC099_02525 [Corallococcus sp.]|nr:deoxyuridine 5'-triphosphate nucleotidohydrolase [Bacillota bacterium]MCM1533508.1 hypothetical protein [Corallococcus sp.]
MRIKAKFEKVSYGVYAANGDRETYDNIKLPVRATKCSAGYDFFAPNAITLQPNETATVATGIRVIMPDDVCLMIFPRSGLGFKYRLKLNNTVGIIDADYSNSDNEGHIFIRMTNESDKPLFIDKGAAFAQGVFVNYLITSNDATEEERNGGLGSSDKKR